MLDSSPQVVYDNSLPEVHENIEDATKERAPSHHIPKPGFKWLLMIIASVVAVAIDIGVGIGIWRHREHGSHRSSTTTRRGFRRDRVSSWLIFIARQHRAQRRRKILRPSTVPIAQVLQNTSLMTHL